MIGTMKLIHQTSLLVGLLLASAQLDASNVVVSWTTQTTVTGGSTVDEPGVTFENTTVAVTSFATSNQIYGVYGLADAAYVRRNHDSNHDTVLDSTGDTTNQSSIWYRDGAGGAATRQAVHQNDYAGPGSAGHQLWHL